MDLPEQSFQRTRKTAQWRHVNTNSTSSEVSECISLLKRHRAAGPDELPSALFKDGGGFLSQCLSSPFGFIWEKETVPDNWVNEVATAGTTVLRYMICN
ncbi:hypothetical protein T265_06821 [Opisthorchis viverrini]|uniref:Uncharacterized protein n=1 Tax=Opisthorchis viverrini TaxID=6198 RepID=A0A075AD17_OPIVI|nr:hypothetical protein T265_06821 [Opisthorchis viverrini]KER25789.1 hypothetical protein T265_06821 [Opisthorchis viverrini]